MEAPEKIYIDVSLDSDWGITDITERSYDNEVEYTRTDAFIEKACDWLSCHPSSHYDDLEEFLNAFRKVMKRD